MTQTPDDFLKNLISEAESDETPNKGHDALIDDVTDLLSDVALFEYHDFKNSTHAAPKIALREKFLELAQNVIDGKYDN